MTTSSDPSETSEFWLALFKARPDVLHRLIADVYKIVAGTVQRVPTTDELMALFERQEFTVKPFPDAVRELLGARSVRWLAGQLGQHHNQVQRVINGERPLILVRDIEGSMIHLNEYAQALGVHPAYFAEWRRLWTLLVIEQAMNAEPSAAVGVYRRFSGFQPKVAPPVSAKPHRRRATT